MDKTVSDKIADLCLEFRDLRQKLFDLSKEYAITEYPEWDTQISVNLTEVAEALQKANQPVAMLFYNIKVGDK